MDTVKWIINVARDQKKNIVIDAVKSYLEGGEEGVQWEGCKWVAGVGGGMSGGSGWMGTHRLVRYCMQYNPYGLCLVEWKDIVFE